MRDLADIIGVYSGSDGDATKALYDELEKLGPIGIVALNLFRATKASERAKIYRRRGFRGKAYERKQWSMENACVALSRHADALGLVWGWGIDEAQEFHRHVLYVDLPTGQVSFHTDYRGGGPEYPRDWDGLKGQGADRICRWTSKLLAAVPA